MLVVDYSGDDAKFDCLAKEVHNPIVAATIGACARRLSQEKVIG